MQLSSKHQQQTIVRADFSGGLNTTSIPEMIADNQLAECTNMEFNKATGALQTACGTACIMQTYGNIGNITDLFYDQINNLFLCITEAEEGECPNIYYTRLIDNGKEITFSDCTSKGSVATQADLPSDPEVGDMYTVLTWELDSDVDWYTILTPEYNIVVVWNGEKWKRYGTTMCNFNLIGQLTGTSKPMVAMWENGLLIASGGHLQYFYVREVEATEEGHAEGAKVQIPTLDVIDTSPEVCNGVFIKSGRVWIWYNYTLHCSSVGDETDWTTDTSVASSSQWVNIGYKEGEFNNSSIVGVAPLSSDVIVIKADGKVYRLSGEVGSTDNPWTLTEVARNIHILNSRSYCAINDGVMVLGRTTLFYLQATQTYGDVHPENMAININKLMLELSTDNTRMVFLPSRNEVWITGEKGVVITYDVKFKSYLRRKFASEVVDIVPDYHEIPLVVRPDMVTSLQDGLFSDQAFCDKEEPIEWHMVCKSGTALNGMLVKRCDVHYVPLAENFTTCYVGLADKRIKINLQSDTPQRNDWNDPIGESDIKVAPIHTMIKGGRAVWRTRITDIELYGNNAPVIVEGVIVTYVEV